MRPGRWFGRTFLLRVQEAERFGTSKVRQLQDPRSLRTHDLWHRANVVEFGRIEVFPSGSVLCGRTSQLADTAQQRNFGTSTDLRRGRRPEFGTMRVSATAQRRFFGTPRLVATATRSIVPNERGCCSCATRRFRPHRSDPVGATSVRPKSSRLSCDRKPSLRPLFAVDEAALRGKGWHRGLWADWRTSSLRSRWRDRSP